MLSAIVRPLKIYAEALSTVDSLVISAQAERKQSKMLPRCYIHVSLYDLIEDGHGASGPAYR